MKRLDGCTNKFKDAVLLLHTFTNSVDPDEMQHYAAFYLGLYCLQKYSFRVFLNL